MSSVTKNSKLTLEGDSHVPGGSSEKNTVHIHDLTRRRLLNSWICREWDRSSIDQYDDTKLLFPPKTFSSIFFGIPIHPRRYVRDSEIHGSLEIGRRY